MKVEITYIRIVRLRSQCTTAFFHTTLPSGQWPFEGNAIFKMELSGGTAEEYCTKHFPGVLMTIIEE